MLEQALHLSKSRPQIHELGIRSVHMSHRRRLPSVTGPGIISQFESQPVPSLGGTVKNSFPSRLSHVWLVWSTLQAGRGLAV
jgi:hypothetical protein